MAVNDLMMRIQLLVDSGKSSAQIGRVSKALTDFNKQLEKIANVKLDLKQQIAQFDELKQSLKQVNAKTFVQELAKVENAFKRLQLDTKNLDDLRKVFTELDLKKSAQQANDYAGQIKKINDQIKEANKYSLRNAWETPASSIAWITQRKSEIQDFNKKIKETTDGIRTQRQEIISLNKQLNDSANLYAAKRITDDPTAKTLQQLTDELAKSQSKLSGFNRLLSQAKDRLDSSREAFRSLTDEAKQFNKTKLLDFGIKQSDVATIDSFLSRIGKSIDVASIQNARNEIISLKDQIRLQQDEVKRAKLVEPAALGDLNRVKALLRSNSDELARQSKQIADQKKLRAEALLLTDAEYKKIKDLRAANENTAQSIASYTISAKQAKQFISELNSEIRGIKFDAKLAKELSLPDQSAQLNQLKQIRSELQSIDINRLSDLRNNIREIQQGNARGTFTFVNQNQIEGERDSIRKVTQDIRDLRQLLRVEGQPNLINFKDSSGQARNLINEITTLKNRALQLKTISAGDGLVKVSSVDTATQQRLSDELKSLKERNELYVQASTKLGDVKTAFENSHAAAKAGDAAAKKSISDLIKEYNQLSKVAGLGANSGLQVNVKTETAIAKIKELEDSLKTLSTKNYELFTKTFSDLNNLKPIEIDTKVALSGLNQIQKAIRDIKSEQQAFKLEKIVPLDAQTKVYEKEKAALDLLRESVRKYNEENDKKNANTVKLDRYKDKVEALANEFKKLTDAGKFNRDVFNNIFSGSEIGKVDLGNLLKQIDLLERQSAFGKINSALLNQQNSERAKELATLVRQEAMGKNNLATIKEQLDQVNQLVTAERNRAKVATQEIKSNQLNSKLSELNALKAINEELKTILKTEDTRRKGLRETARLLLEQGKLRSFNFNTNDLQYIVNANKVAREQAEQSINALKNVVQQRKDEISQLEKQKQLNAESYQREIDRLNATRAVTEAQKKANEVEKLRLTSLRDQQQTTIDFDIATAQNKLNQLQSSFDQAKSKLNDYIRDARVAAKEAENLAKSDISGRQASIRLLDQAIGKIKERVKADEQAIKSYEKGIKIFEQQIKADIRAANERIATGQLTKAQYEEEKKGINDLIKLRKQYSNEYIQTLKDRQAGVEAELRSENDRIKLLERQAKAVDAVTKAQIEREIASRKSALAQQGGLESQVKQSIRDTEALTRAELNRLKALEQIEKQGNSLFSIFHRLNGTASVQPAIQATRTLLDETNRQLTELGNASTKARTKLSAIGNAATDVKSVNDQIKSTINELRDLNRIGLGGGNQANYLKDRLNGLREERKLLREIAQIDTKTQEGRAAKSRYEADLKNLQAAANEMGRLQRFMAGFQFALTPEMLGMSAFGMVAGAVQQFIRSFIDANRQIETMTRGMDAIFGAGQGEVQFEKLAGLANKYGLALQDLSRNYLNLNASAKGTILEGAEADRIFRSLSAAMAVLGADTITTQRAFRAVGQMISKGQVYAEELKGQLAEALPGAIQLFAKSMGKTTQEFLAMVKAGQVGVNELIPFFKEIEATYGNAATASTTYEQATNRLSNAWVLLMKNIGDTGAWKRIVSLIDGAANALNRLAEGDIFQSGDDIGTTKLSRSIDEIKKKIESLQEIKILSKVEFDQLPEIKSNDQKVKIYGSLIFENYDEAVKTINTLNEGNKQQLESLQKQLAEKEKLARIELYESNKERIQELTEVTQKYKSLETFVREFNQANNEAGFFSKQVKSSAQLEQEWAKTFAEIEKKYFELKKLIEDNKGLKVQIDADSASDKAAADSLKLNKQFIRQITDELKTQQQAYYTINTIQQKVLSNDLKRLQALSGISGLDSKLAPLIIDEAKSTISLTNALKALSRAREIESAIVRNNADTNKNTKPEEIAAIRKLTLEQLNHAMTIARSANNQSLVLAILREQSRVMRDIRLSEAIFNEQPLSGLSNVSEDVRKQIEGINKALAQSTTETNNTVREMSELLSLTEQRNRLLKLKTDSQFDQASYAQQIAWEQRLYEVETKTKSKRKRAVEALAVANEALAAAQQQLAIMQTSQDPAEVERARAEYEKLLKFIDPLTGKFQNLKKDAIAFNQAFSNLKIQGVQVALNVNDQAIDQQLAALETKIKSYVEYINQDTGELDFTKAIDVAVNNLNDLQKQYKDLQDQVNRSSGDDKTELERQMKSLLISIAEAESQLKELQGNFNAQNVGKPIKFTIDPAIQEDLKTKLGALQTILNGKPLTFETQVDATNPEQKVQPAHDALQNSANQKPVIYPAQVGDSQSPEPPKVEIDTSFVDPTNDINQLARVVNTKVDQNIKPVSMTFNPPQNVDPFLRKVSTNTKAVFTSLATSQNKWGDSVGSTVMSAGKLIDYFANKSRIVITSTFDQMAISVQVAFRRVMSSILEVYAGITSGIADTFEKIAILLEKAGATDAASQLRKTVAELRSNKQAYQENEAAIRSLNEAQRNGAEQTQRDLQAIEQQYRSLNQSAIKPMSAIVNNDQLQQQLAMLGQFADLVDIELRSIGENQTEITIIPKINTNAARQQYQAVLTTLEQSGFIKTAVSIDVEDARRRAVQAQQSMQGAIQPIEVKITISDLQSKIDAIKTQIQSLESQIPQGIIPGGFSDEVNAKLTQIASLRAEFTNLQSQLNELNAAAQKPIAPVVNTQPLTTAQQEITKVTQTINESKIGEPIVVTMETQQAIAQLQELIRQRDEFQKNGLSQPNVDPSTYYNTLDQMQQKINALMDNTDMAVAQFVKNYSMHFVKGNEIVVNSFSEIKSRGIDALRKDYQNLKLDNIEVKVDEAGFRKQVKRLEIVGQNSEPFIMRNFQVQANTWDEIVSEGNRYMQTKDLILKGKLDPNSVNDLQAIPVKPTFDDPVQAYRDLKDKIEQQNPIVVSANAQSMIGEIQSELARLQDSGATNIKVTFDEESGKLVVTADTDPANKAVNEIIRKIESKDVVLTVKVREVQAKSNGGYIHRRTGGAIPGYGGGDRVRALLEPGEFVLRKESVRSLGLDYLNRLNQLGRSVPKLSDNINVPRFANGGAVSGQPIVINVPGNKPIRLSGSRDAASQLVKVLTQTGRAL